MRTMWVGRRVLVASVAMLLLTACGADESPEAPDVTGEEPTESPAESPDMTEDEPDAPTTGDGPDAAPGGGTAAPREPGDRSCQEAVDEVAEAGDLDAAVDRIDEAISACEDVDSLMAAAQSHADALDTTELEALVTARCAADDPIADSPICQEVVGS